MSLLFAATYPQRTRALVLTNSFARLAWAPDYPWGAVDELRDAILDRIDQGWGTGEGLSEVAPTRARDAAERWADRLARGIGWHSAVDQAPSSEISSVPSSSARPFRTSRILPAPSIPTRSTSRVRSMVRIWETFTTLARESPASPRRRRTFPGMAPSRRFDVTAATTVVEMALRLKRSCCTTRAGRRPAGAEPSAGPK